MAGLGGQRSHRQLRAEHESRHAVIAVHLGLAIDRLDLIVDGNSRGRVLLHFRSEAERARRVYDRILVGYAGLVGKPGGEPQDFYAEDIRVCGTLLSQEYPSNWRHVRAESLRAVHAMLHHQRVIRALEVVCPLVFSCLERGAVAISGIRLMKVVRACFRQVEGKVTGRYLDSIRDADCAESLVSD